MFGSLNTNNQPTNQTGQSLFGSKQPQQQQQTIFSQPQNQPSLFQEQKQTTQSNFGGGLFGNSLINQQQQTQNQNQPQSLFGSSQNTNVVSAGGSSFFGGANQTQGTTGGSLFGAAQPSTFNFGSTVPSGGGLFGGGCMRPAPTSLFSNINEDKNVFQIEIMNIANQNIINPYQSHYNPNAHSIQIKLKVYDSNGNYQSEMNSFVPLQYMMGSNLKIDVKKTQFHRGGLFGEQGPACNRLHLNVDLGQGGNLFGGNNHHLITAQTEVIPPPPSFQHSQFNPQPLPQAQQLPTAPIQQQQKKPPAENFITKLNNDETREQSRLKFYLEKLKKEGNTINPNEITKPSSLQQLQKKDRSFDEKEVKPVDDGVPKYNFENLDAKQHIQPQQKGFIFNPPSSQQNLGLGFGAGASGSLFGGGGLFGSSQNNSVQPSVGLFGTAQNKQNISGTIFNQQVNNPPSSLFGGKPNNQTQNAPFQFGSGPQTGVSLFGNIQVKQQQTPLFGAQPQQKQAPLIKSPSQQQNAPQLQVNTLSFTKPMVQNLENSPNQNPFGKLNALQQNQTTSITSGQSLSIFGKGSTNTNQTEMEKDTQEDSSSAQESFGNPFTKAD